MTREELTQHSVIAIKALLGKYLPSGTAVYLFGSRARGTAAWNADFDLWVDASLDQLTLGRINDELEESFVPFKVDIVQSSQLQGLFGELVKRDARRWM